MSWIISQKIVFLANIHYLFFLRDIQEGNLTLKDADEEQSELVNILKDLNRGVKPVEKRSFLDNIGLLLSEREKIVNNFRSKIFSVKNF